MEGILVIAFSLLGTIAGGLLCLIPSLHIYNVAGIAIILWIELSNKIPYYTIGPFFMALMVSFALAILARLTGF